MTVALQAMGIQRHIFCSIHNCEAFPSVPLMQIKACTEDFLKTSSLDYTILRLCGFHQAIIGNYAVRPHSHITELWSISPTVTWLFAATWSLRCGC